MGFWKKDEPVQEAEPREAGAASPAESSQQQPKPCCSKRAKQQEAAEDAVKIGSAPKGSLALIGNCKPAGTGDTIAACQWRVMKSSGQQPKPKITIFF